MKAFRIAMVLFLAAFPAWAQHEEVVNPRQSPEDVAVGGRIFRSHCAVCHGLGGVGDRAPNLTTGQFRHATSDSALHEVVSRGIPGTEMPGVYFNGAEVWQVVAYVRSLSGAATDEKITGDVAAGQKVYASKSCARCHRVNSEGGRSGPDLSRIGGSRSQAHLRAAVVNPNEKVLPNQWRFSGATKDGTIVSGRLLNEDTYTVQMFDARLGLMSLAKADMASYEVLKESAMPSYEGSIAGKDLDDLTAYLASLR
ncbi:MAG: c-type cytochrome [Acidobacteria bacterium]|nr:c-type cytochrome [Acidobacteriota bacterium]MDA1234092.1 c-type cytochrome [Acidobacteriota bacterium]